MIQEDFSWRIWRIGWYKDWSRDLIDVGWADDNNSLFENRWKRVFMGLMWRV